MKNQFGFIAVIWLSLGLTGYTQTRSTVTGSAQKGAAMVSNASGAFDVKITPQKPDNKEAEAAGLGRMSIDKQFHGDLEAISKARCSQRALR